MPHRLLIIAIAFSFFAAAGAANAGELELRVVDEATNQPMGARVQLRDTRGRPRRIKRAAAFGDHFSVYGPTIVPLTGQFEYVIRSGPEYLEHVGGFTIKRDATDNHSVTLKRFIDMKSKGWWSGDPWAEREARDAPLLLLSEDLHLLGLPQSAEEFQADSEATTHDNRAADPRGQVYLEAGGRIHIWNPSPADAPTIALDTEKSNKSHIEIATPDAWDLPLWLATGNVDSISLHQPTLTAKSLAKLVPPGRPTDDIAFGGRHGIGRYHESIYHHVLNTGLRIPPSATSASGVSQQAPGTYRTYVHLGDAFTADAWWEGLRAGRVMITNGPLIVATVNGEVPGHVFRAAAGESVSLQAELSLHTREKVDYLEFIKDGETVRQVRLDEWVSAKGKLEPFVFDGSGWMIVRAVTNHGATYQYASTAPYYIEIGEQPRISRKSSQYFLDWVVDRAQHLKDSKDPNRTALLPHLRNARDYWQQRVEVANAE